MSQKRLQRMRARRLQRLYRTVAIVLFTFFLVGGIVSSIFTRDVQASSVDDGMKYYASIQIQNGDSLWSIADEYADEHYTGRFEYVSEVAEINGIHMNDRLISGEYIVVPYYK